MVSLLTKLAETLIGGVGKPLIRTHQLSKVFKNGDVSLTALNGIDLEIQKGEMVALTGPSGSGKSTLMHLLGCLDSPSSGQFFLEGKEVSSFSSRQLAHVRNRKIGFVFQNFHLLEDLSALENVILPQLYGGISEKRAKEKAKELLEMVGLSHRLEHRPSQLSGGQRQRIAIARALAMDPPLILADEPTGNLDSENVEMTIELLFTINRLKQVTVVIVTHERSIAQRMPRSLVMKDGSIASDVIQ